MLFSSSLLDMRGAAASPRTPATGIATLNPRTGYARQTTAAGRIPTTAGAIRGRARRGPRRSASALLPVSGATFQVKQVSEFHKESPGSTSPAPVGAGAADGRWATMSSIVRRKIGVPGAVNAAVNQMDQVTPQNAVRLIPTSRRGQFAPRAGSVQEGRGGGDL
ncbi:MAG: hypothetical protein Q8J89_17160 [Caulobacter sp.]|nr:hypothetical protein [Caulobacter sp.]